MIVSKIGTDDIDNIGTSGKLVVTLPDDSAVKSIKSLISRAKKLRPRKDGMTYTTKSDTATNTLTIEVVSPENVRRKKANS